LHKNSDLIGGKWKATVSCLGGPLSFLVDVAKLVIWCCSSLHFASHMHMISGSKRHESKLAGMVAEHACRRRTS
jgi:hypothetical protein